MNWFENISYCLFVGVNAVDLCLSNCTWVEQYSEDLYPLDAGIDSGTTYTVNSMDSICIHTNTYV